eukprot:807225_1
MSNSVQRLREEFEKLSALAALDIYPDYPEPDSPQAKPFKHSDASEETDDTTYNKQTYNAMSYPIITKKENANVDKPTQETESIQLQTTNKLDMNGTVSYSQFEDMDDMLSNDTRSETDKYKTKLKDMEDKLRKKTIFAKDLQGQIDEYRYKEDEEHNEMRNTLIELEGHIKETKQSKNELIQQNTSLRLRIESLQQQLAHKNNKIQELADSIAKNSELHTRRESQSHLDLQKATSNTKSYRR